MEKYLERLVANQDVEGLQVEVYHIRKEINELIKIKTSGFYSFERMKLNQQIVGLEEELELTKLCLDQVIDNKINNILLTNDY